MAKLKTVLKWVYTHSKLCVLFLVILLFTILILWWGRKNKRIKDLENQLAILQAKFNIERLIVKYNTNMEEFKKLAERDQKVSADLVKIEKSLGEKLKSNMTAEEIAAKFREIGIK